MRRRHRDAACARAEHGCHGYTARRPWTSPCRGSWPKRTITPTRFSARPAPGSSRGGEHAVAVPRTGTIIECEEVARGHERRSFPTDALGNAWLHP